MRKIDEILEARAGECSTASGIAGFSILSQTTSRRNGVYFCQLKPYRERRTACAAGRVGRRFGEPQARRRCPTRSVFAFLPPAIPGIGQASGIDFFIQDRAGKTVDYLWQNTQKFLAAARKRPELAGMRFTFSPSVPQLFAAVDKDKVFKLGISIDQVYRALQTLLGGYYVNQFNRFGRVWKVFVEAEPQYRTTATASRTVLRSQQRGQDGPAIDAGQYAARVRPGIYHALQRVPQHRDFRASRRPATAPAMR